MKTNDKFNSSLGQYTDYTTIIGGVAPKTEIPPAATYPINVWSKQNLTSSLTCSISNLTNFTFDVNNGISVSNYYTNERRFVFSDISIFKDCATVLEFITPSSGVNTFSIGALLRYKYSTNSFLCFGIESQNLKIKSFDGTAYSDLTSVACTLTSNTSYYLVAIAVGRKLRCELWSADPRTIGSGRSVRSRVVSFALPDDTYNIAGRVGVANWVPRGNINGTSSIKSFETGAAFISTLSGNIDLITQSRHVNIRSIINNVTIAPRLIDQVEKFHQAQNVYSQTASLLTDPVSGTFKLLIYNSSETYFEPVVTPDIPWNASSDQIKSAISNVVKNNYKFSSFNGDAIISVTTPDSDSCFPFTLEFNHFYGDLSLLRADVSSLRDSLNNVPVGTPEYWDDNKKILTFTPNFQDTNYLQSANPIDRIDYNIDPVGLPAGTLNQTEISTQNIEFNENWKLYSDTGGILQNKKVQTNTYRNADHIRILEIKLPPDNPWEFSVQSSMPLTTINSIITEDLTQSSINVSFLSDEQSGSNAFNPNVFGNYTGRKSYIQFTSNKDGLFENQGGNSIDDSAKVYITPSLVGSLGNIDFRTPMSTFVSTVATSYSDGSSGTRFSFGCITGVRLVFYHGNLTPKVPIKIAGVKAIENSTYLNKVENIEINTRAQFIEKAVKPSDQASFVSLPPMIRGTTLSGEEDHFQLNGKPELVITVSDNSVSNTVGFNKFHLYSRYICNLQSNNAEWITTEFGFNKNNSYFKTFKTYRFRSEGHDSYTDQMYWDIHPGGIAEDFQISGYTAWLSTAAYNVGDVVQHNGRIYRAMKTNLQNPNKLYDIEPSDNLPNSDFWGRIDTITDLKNLESNSRYIVSNSLESNNSTSMLEIDNFRPKIVYNGPKYANAEWQEKAGRVGWYAEILDDSAIESFDFASSGYAILKTKEILTNTPVDGAQLFTKDSGVKNVFEDFTSNNPIETISIDNSKTKSAAGSYRLNPIGDSLFPGFMSNQFTISNWANIQIEFDIWVPAALNTTDLKPKIYLMPADFSIFTGENTQLNYIGPLEFRFSSDIWSKVSVDVRQYSLYPTGDYFIIIASNYPHTENVWIDNMKINCRTVEWEIRAIRGGAWVPFRDKVNNPYGAIRFAPNQRGKEIQLQARALTEDAWISEYTLIPHYTSLGRILYLNRDERLSTVTGAAIVGTYDQKSLSVDTKEFWDSGTSYSKGDAVDYRLDPTTKQISKTYVSLSNSNVGNQPNTSSSSWTIQAFQGDWSAGATYLVGDSVIYSKTFYRCISAPPSHQNPTNATYWKKLTAATESGLNAYAVNLAAKPVAGDIEASSDQIESYTIAK